MIGGFFSSNNLFCNVKTTPDETTGGRESFFAIGNGFKATKKTP